MTRKEAVGAEMSEFVAGAARIDYWLDTTENSVAKGHSSTHYVSLSESVGEMTPEQRERFRAVALLGALAGNWHARKATVARATGLLE